MPIKKLMRNTASCLLIIAVILIFDQTSAQKSGRPGSSLKQKLKLPTTTLNINPVGLALYGPIIQMEFQVAPRLYVVPEFRYSYAGFASQYQWTNFEDDSKFSPASVALGVGVRAFIPVKSKKQLLYYGFFEEFIHEKGLHNMDSDYEYEQTRLALATYGNFGYRWNLGRTFYLNLGFLAGIAIDLKNQGLYSSGASEGLEFGDYKKNTFIGMFDIALGWNLE
jgi:hypothetical protein